MTRMIEEERIEIGTLKSLGYTDLQIIIKYILYAFLACIIGGILGMSLGFYLLPSIVWSLYSTMYTIPDFHFNYQLGIGLAGTFIAFACIGGATILVAHSELKSKYNRLKKQFSANVHILLFNILCIYTISFRKPYQILTIYKQQELPKLTTPVF